jgi:hypothetical protein
LKAIEKGILERVLGPRDSNFLFSSNGRAGKCHEKFGHISDDYFANA